MVLAAVSSTVVLVAVAFLHGAGSQPRAAAMAMPDMATCRSTGEQTIRTLVKDHRVRSAAYRCFATSRGEIL